MVIDFEKTEETIQQNFHGGEKDTIGRMHVDDQNRIMYGRLGPGASIGLHAHETSSEIIYILQGTGKALYDGEYEMLRPGLCHYCPKGHEHSLINDSQGELMFFAVVPQQ